MAVAFLRGVVDALRLYAGPPGAWLGIFSAYQIERRPRDARPLLHLFRANYSWGIGARPLGAPLNIASYKQGGRAQMPLASLARNKCRSGLASRCAARAALDLRPTSKPKTGT